MSIGRLLKNAWAVYGEITRQQQYNQAFLLPLLNELETRFKGKFSAEQRTKILRYYGLYITAFLCSSFKLLHGGPLQPAERKRATWFAILTPVGDDLSDIEKLSREALQQITLHPQAYAANSFLSKTACYLQQQLIADVANAAQYLKASQRVLDAQLASELQRQPNIEKNLLENITLEKGAASVCIYHACLQQGPSPEVEAALNAIGGLYQLGNDLFDVHKDVPMGIHTPVTTCNQFADFKLRFMQGITQQNACIRKVKANRSDLLDFNMRINAINARSLVAIDQFIRLEKELGKPIEFAKLTRKQQVVDMENISNILSWLRYCLVCYRL